MGRMRKGNGQRLAVALLMTATLCLSGANMAWGVDGDAAQNTSNTNATNTNTTAENTNRQQEEQSGRTGDLIDLGEDNIINTQQLPDSSFIYDTTIDDLATADTYLEGQTVQVVGEVVGDCIQAEADEGHSWLVLADENDATVSVYLDTEYTELVDTYGKYNTVGTYLQVRGTFNLICADHQGQTDIHADHVSVMQKGKVTTQQIRAEDFFPGVVLLIAGLILFLAFNVLRERLK